MSLHRFLHRKRWDEERVREMEAHLRCEIEDNVARGMSHEEARRRAYLKFGSPTRVREEIWQMNSVAWMENLLRDVRYAWRTLLRNPGYALVAILTLGLGIGANTAIFTVINGVLLRPLPYAQSSRIVHLDQMAAKLGPDPINLSVQEYEDYRGQSRSFSDIAEYHSMLFTLLGAKNPERVATGVVSANYFDVMGVKPELGRLLTPKDESLNAPAVLVLSHAFWIKEFGGDPKVVGRSFAMNDRVHTVVGVLPPLPEYPDANDVYMPTTSCPYRSSKDAREMREMRMITAYGRLKPGVTLRQAQSELTSIAARMSVAWPKYYPKEAGFTAQATSLEQELTHAARPTFLTLLGAAGLVLLLACANMANLALSRQMRRSREMAIRMATGASAWRLFRQLLTESLMVSLAGGLAGVGIAAAGVNLLTAYASRLTPLSDAIHLDGWVLLFAVGISLLTGVLFGAVPGYIACRIRLTSLTETGERMTGNEGAVRLRGVFVAVQVTFSFVLLMCAGLMMRSLYNLLSVDPGFKTANVLSMQLSLNWTKYSSMTAENNFFHELLNRVEALPGIEGASLSWAAPLSGAEPMSGGVLIDGEPRHTDKVPPQVDFEVTSPDYFRVLNVPVLSGRSFTDADALNAPLVTVANARMAQHFWPNQNPIGHRISSDDGKTWRTIVGVVGNVHQFELGKEPKDALYVPLDQHSLGNGHLLVRTRMDPMRMANQVASIVHGIDPQQPVTEIRTLDQLCNVQLSTPRVTAMLLGIFAGVALFITAVGVSGTLALSVARRSKEIGIRIALGATKENILSNVLRQGLMPVIAGLLLGATVSFFATRALTHMLFAVRPDDPMTFAGIAVLLFVVALVGCLVPGRRAVNVDPMKALRME
jgi:putative ABC transport system permease protein